MPRVLFASVLFTCVIGSVRGGGEPVKDAPSVIHLASGKDVKVLSVTRTTLHDSDEPAVSLQYVTDISISDTEKLYAEAEEVFAALRPIAEREKVHAAVVVANEPASGLLSVSKGAGWSWKQRADGSWGPPDDSDHAIVPK
jgi:hypothetical protein